MLSFAIRALCWDTRVQRAKSVRGVATSESGVSGVLPGGLRYLSATGAGKVPVVHTRSKENGGARGGAEILRFFRVCVRSAGTL